MIVIPEIRTLFIVPPRTASTSLFETLIKKYPLTKRLYRHMEAMGVPEEFEHFRHVCLHRPDLERLFSTYKYMKYSDRDKDGWWSIARQDTDRSFEDWLLNSEHPFCMDFDGSRFNSLLFPQPITRKPLWLWARKLGAEHCEFMSIQEIQTEFGLAMQTTNSSVSDIPLPKSEKIDLHMKKYFPQ